VKEKGMETILVIGNMAWSAGLVTIAGYLGKRWMDRIESTISSNRTEAKAERSESNINLSRQLEGIYIELRTANGRTAKIEGRLETQIAICEERNK
jgi:hypothetical protein